MSDKKPTVLLWSVKQGDLLRFTVSIQNGEIICSRDDEFVKFPGGITKDEFMALVEAHNDANEGKEAISSADIQAEIELKESNEKLLEDLQ